MICIHGLEAGNGPCLAIPYKGTKHLPSCKEIGEENEAIGNKHLCIAHGNGNAEVYDRGVEAGGLT